MRKPSRIVLLALLSSCALPSSATAPPLGIPVPTTVTISDLTATSGYGGDVLGTMPGVDACASAPHRPISLSRDEAPHNSETYIEFWWWTAHLATPDGRQLGVMLYFPSKPWAGYYAAEYAITDLSNGTFHYGREPVIVGQAQPIADGFQLYARHAQATDRGGHHHLKLDLAGYKLDLYLQPTKPPVLQWPNGDGYLNAYCQTDYFYSRERMKLTGALARGHKTVAVSGTSNFDHQWGFDAALDFAPWNYWTFQLKDGRDIFISNVQLRRGGDEATVRSGSISDRNGNVTILHRADFTVTPTRFWHRDPTCSWPEEWNVDVRGLHLLVRTAANSAEIRPTSSPATLVLWPGWADYWDGPTIVTGDATGQGFVDQGHYCAA